ncbi:MAG: hypothetical protein N3A57_07260, partial [Negativicutes bacterium]|nr:hypothetical protein [Negativicutes bacterium]
MSGKHNNWRILLVSVLVLTGLGLGSLAVGSVYVPLPAVAAATLLKICPPLGDWLAVKPASVSYTHL